MNVQLSDAARKKLIDSKETIIVAGSLTGHPKLGTEKRYLDIKSGDVDLGDVKQEIRPGESATFDQLNLNPDAVARIDSQCPHILLTFIQDGDHRRTICWIAMITTAVLSQFADEQSLFAVN